MKVFAQKNKDGEWASVPISNSVRGFDFKGYEIIPYLYENIDSIDIEKEDIIVGGIPCVRTILNKFDFQVPNLSIPHDDLLRFCERKFNLITIKELNNIVYKDKFDKFFIKPYREHKLFTGHVVSSFKDLLKSMHVPEDTQIVSSDFVEFVSEYRIFVTNGEIRGMSHYGGDFLVFPNKFVIKTLVQKAYELYGLNGFSVDIGITPDNKTLLVELNDGFSLGCYGLNYLEYTNLIEARWKQINETSNNNKKRS